MHAAGSQAGTNARGTGGSAAQKPTLSGHLGQFQSTIQRPGSGFGVLRPGSSHAVGELARAGISVVVSCTTIRGEYIFRGDLIPGTNFEG